MKERIEDRRSRIEDRGWSENGKLAADDKLQDPVVLKINLDARWR
jgi:hypothetical protein